MKDAFLLTIGNFIERQRLLDRGRLHLLALSGGADSMALMVSMLKLGYRVEAVHCNFKLRGSESDRDEHFCIDQCEAMGVALHRVHFDTMEYSRLHHVSVEMAARQLRYSHFERLRRDIGADSILVAHHRDDAVETVLINLVRGTGIDGLGGIAPRNGNVVRPLLAVDRQQVLEFLQRQGVPFVTDSTNLVDDVVRNKIRLDVLPLLRSINPSVSKSIFETSCRVAQATDILQPVLEGMVADATLSADERETVVDASKLQHEYVLHRLMRHYGFAPRQAEMVYGMLEGEGSTGRIVEGPTHELLVDRRRIVIRAIVPPFRQVIIPETGTYVLGDNEQVVVDTVAVDADFQVCRHPDMACLDIDTMRFPLTVRTVRRGDRFRPLGMKGSKLVSDFLTDMKCSLFEKRDQKVVADANGRIVWVMGKRPDERCRITQATHTACLLSYRHS